MQLWRHLQVENCTFQYVLGVTGGKTVSSFLKWGMLALTLHGGCSDGSIQTGGTVSWVFKGTGAAGRMKKHRCWDSSDVAMVMRGKRHRTHCSSWVVDCKGEWRPRIRLPRFQRSSHPKVVSMKVKIKSKNDATQHENQTCLMLSKIKAVGQLYLLENLLSVLPFAK